MKKKIHPKYEQAVITCACGNTIETRSTKGNTHIDICSQCHPFFTGKQKFVDSDGRIEKFKKKYRQVKKQAVEEKSVEEAPVQAEESAAAEEGAPQAQAEGAGEPAEETGKA